MSDFDPKWYENSDSFYDDYTTRDMTEDTVEFEVESDDELFLMRLFMTLLGVAIVAVVCLLVLSYCGWGT